MINSQKKKIIEIKMPIKNIPDKYWRKIEVSESWDEEYQVKHSERIPMMINADELEERKHNNGKYYENYPWDKSFKNEAIFNGFKKFTKDDEIFFKHRYEGWADFGEERKQTAIKNIKFNEWFCIAEPIKLTKYLRDANKIFIKDGYGKLTNQEAFEFLKSIVDSQEIEATLKLTSDEFSKFFDLENQLKEKNLQNQHLKQEVDNLTNELLELKRKELAKIINSIKSRLNEISQDFLDIFLAAPEKSKASEKAKKNLKDINNNELQKLLLLQHQVNHLEKRNSYTQLQAQIETLPPSYN